MKIGPVGNSGRPLRPEDDKRSRQNEAKADVEVRPKDAVEITPEGQNYGRSANRADEIRVEDARQSDAVEQSAAEEEVRQANVEQARARAESDYYNDLRVRQEIAGRIADDLLS